VAIDERIPTEHRWNGQLESNATPKGVSIVDNLGNARGQKADMTIAFEDVCFWHKADIGLSPGDVRFWG
jgi:hypothetical protein